LGIEDRATARQVRESIERRSFIPPPHRRGTRRAIFGCLLLRRSSGAEANSKLVRPVLLLRGLRLASAPFLGRKKAHARTVALVVARGLTGILERSVVTRSVPARAELSFHLGRNSRCAAASNGRRFRTLRFIVGHSSSLFFDIGRPLQRFRSFRLASALADNQAPKPRSRHFFLEPLFERDESAL
jgi:hypothetical protein